MADLIPKGRLVEDDTPTSIPRGRLAEDDAPVTARGVARQFTGGANEELANVWEGPGYLFHEGIYKPLYEFFTGEDHPGRTSTVGNVLRSGNMPAEVGAAFTEGPSVGPRYPMPAPQNMPERIARRAGQEVGASVPYAAMPYALPLAGPAREARGPIRGAGRAILEGVRNTPAKAAVGELAATSGAGVGAGVAGEIAPGSTGAEITGQLVGGVAPAALMWTPTALIARGGAKLAGHLYATAKQAMTGETSPVQTRRAEEYVADRLDKHGAITGKYGDNIARSEEVRGEIGPDFQPSLAEATGSPALTRTQQGLEGIASGEHLERYAERHARNRAAVSRYAEEKAPEGGGPDIVVDTATGKVTSLVAGIEQDIAAVEGRRAGLMPPRADRAGIGEALRGSLNDRRAQVKAQMSALADELGLNDLDVTGSVRALANRLRGSIEPNNPLNDKTVPDAYTDLKTALRATEQSEGVVFGPMGRQSTTTVTQPKQFTLDDLMSFRSRIGDDIRDELSSATPKRARVRKLLEMRREIDAAVDDIGNSIDDPELAGRYQTFRSRYYEDYIQTFEQGAAFKARRTKAQGDYLVPDERVADIFAAPGNVTAARQFKAIFGDDPQAMDALAASVVDDLISSAVVDGALDPKRFAGWRRRWGSVLDEFPTLRDTIDGKARLNETLLERRAHLTDRRMAIEGQILTKELTRAGEGTIDPEDVIAGAMKSRGRMSALMMRLSPEAQSALKRDVWFRALKMGPDKVDHDMLKTVLGDEHYRNLQTIYDAEAILARTAPPAGKPDAPTPFAEAEALLGMGLPQFGSRVFAWKSGRMQKGYLAVDVISRFFRGRSMYETARIYEEALYNPAVAADLAEMIRVKGIKPEVANRLNTRLFNLGLGSRREDDE